MIEFLSYCTKYSKMNYFSYEGLRTLENLKHTFGLNLSPKNEDFVLDKLAFLELLSGPKTL